MPLNFNQRANEKKNQEYDWQRRRGVFAFHRDRDAVIEA